METLTCFFFSIYALPLTLHSWIDDFRLFIDFCYTHLDATVRPFSATVTKKEEVEVFVDGKSVMIEQGAALIQACEKAGADVSVDIGCLPCVLIQNLCYWIRFLASVTMVMPTHSLESVIGL
jgi:hypothetical protein